MSFKNISKNFISPPPSEFPSMAKFLPALTTLLHDSSRPAPRQGLLRKPNREPLHHKFADLRNTLIYIAMKHRDDGAQFVQDGTWMYFQLSWVLLRVIAQNLDIALDLPVLEDRMVIVGGVMKGGNYHHEVLGRPVPLEDWGNGMEGCNKCLSTLMKEYVA